MKKWFSRKSDIKAREIAALEDANRLEQERLGVEQGKLRLGQQNARINEQIIADMKQKEMPKARTPKYDMPAIPDGVVPKG